MTTRVFIGHLSYQVREKDVDRFFKGYGRVGDIHLKNGFGFVEFEDHRDADDAIKDLNGKELLGERVSVELAHGSRRGPGGRILAPGSRDWRSPPGGGGGGGGRYQGGSRDSRFGPPVRTNYQLVVENLSSHVSWQDLKDYMRQAGEVTFTDAHSNRPNEGLVEFSNYADMRNALSKLDNTDLSGRRIKLYESKKSRASNRKSRSDSPRNNRSRSRSASPPQRHHSASKSPPSKRNSPDD
ncbi:hypothetical protein HPB52_009738 [Rhipicephalus sanguineus]|uniref:RRM domain-containing protein n=1 Tax=Rhipicephalus sanguineus TaxID=34632 RepID=A0A9D4PE42_RHISA|nr:hypothetical protein HPB52_009738 [Rhipicephalus sanguineus]